MSVWLAGAALCAMPAWAQQQTPSAEDPLAPIDTQMPQDTLAPQPAKPVPAPTPAPTPAPSIVPPVVAPTPEQEAGSIHPYVPPRVAPKDWKGVFAAIRTGDWLGAQLGIAALPDGPLKPVAKAELYTAKNSPKVDLASINALLVESPDLPHTEQLQRMAIARGASSAPGIAPRPTVFLGSAPRRQRARPVANEPLADALRAQLDPLVRADDFAAAEALLIAQGPFLTPDARAEAGQRVAWIYYVLGQDGEARRVADQWRVGAGGEWGGQAAWISGLAAWRQNDCTASAAAFRETARLTADRELAAAAFYWAARSEQACRRPREVQGLLKAAARSADSFYGLVARETLGMPTTIAPASRSRAGGFVPMNLLRARELSAIGERGLADEFIRYQARLSPPGDHHKLLALAEELNLPATEYWLAHNGQPGAPVQAADRFPTLRWRPTTGWRIDPALGMAHTRQESDFRAGVVSPAGAVGLMQVRPGTAGDFARARGTAVGDLKDPSVNLEYGQSFIELMRGKAATRGQILKIIAAYNAGPVPVDRWNFINDRGDPLLWIESLPYWETRYYVPAVLRNMFVYQGLDGRDQPALKTLAEHKWPAFPTAPGSR
ncbi:lytic transglycosylase domain-containing protein [Sphingomonas rhizophila]|uniref:Lytic transglycosylase domain-containing protein n=1 Tax=Sphingomonas rhizophila TaxID=2071607 RepID=A0A7G9SDD4_9SPHN|nr:lytic transglycosylase domain-containing protein [Sphingomonas rhizophila]QNN65859.1 lytic transglycosylase domain-containing protein [Sphingomonas rhizophila]